ncbi:hypothetical protein [Winogradskyella sp. MH6]|uniref:hypothetical protein n=1 Tax=Winogradskyella sp. MH6 TaxID=2929510 RepID=UPI001FB49B5D|nr:hypothetical protein [Winogradskyella sp. MH6]
MKSYKITSLLIIFFSLVLMSCSKEERLDKKVNILGVWEKTEVGIESTTTFRLVFGSNNTGIKTESTQYASGEIISNALSFTWELNNNEVNLYDDNEVHIDTYIITNGDQLFLTNNTLQLEKVSDDYTHFF